MQPSCNSACTRNERRRFANVVGAALESQAQHAEVLAAQGPQRAAHFAQETVALIFVDAHDFIEQAELVAALARDGAKRHHIFRKAGPAVADSGIEKARPDARIGADALHHLPTLAPTDSQTDATALMKEIFIARKALEACLISSALLVLVTMRGAGIEVRSGCGMASLRW